MSEFSERICVRCNKTFKHDWTSETWLPISLCPECMADTEANPTPVYSLFYRLSKKLHRLEVAVSTMDDVYRQLLHDSRTPEKIVLEEKQQEYEREHGIRFFGPRWRPDEEQLNDIPAQFQRKS